MKYKLIILLGLVFLSLTMVSASTENLLDGLLCYYNMSEASGVVIDIHMGKHNMTAGGSWVRNSPGIQGGGLNGTHAGDNNLTIPFDQALNLTRTGNMTINFWLKELPSQPTKELWIKHGGAVQTAYTGASDYVWESKELDGTASTLTASGLVEGDRWVMLTYVANGSDVLFYKNGSLEEKDAYDGTLRDNGLGLDFRGDGSAANKYINGTIDELGWWNRSLTSDEITSLWNSGAGTTYDTFTQTDPLTPSVVLNVPSNGANLSNAGEIFNATLSVTSANGELSNATLYVWYSNGTLFNKTETTSFISNSTNINVTNLNIDSFKWNVWGCVENATASDCAYAGSNYTFDYGYTFNSHSFSTPVTELSSQTFTLNMTLIEGLASSDAYLIYNNTWYLSTSTTVGSNEIFSRDINIPDVSGQTNITFTWELILQDSNNKLRSFNLTTSNQSVSSITLDNCTLGSLPILGLDLVDEGSQATIVNSTSLNMTIEVQLTLTNPANLDDYTVFNKTYTNKNPAQVCVGTNDLNNTDYQMDAIIRYETTDRDSEYYNVQNFTLTNNTTPQNITLYDLLSADSTEFIVTYKDDTFLPLSGALLSVTRQYLSDGVFKTVEAPVTDIDGQTITHLVKDSATYTFVVSKDGRNLATFSNIVPVCQNPTLSDCTINLAEAAAPISPEDYSTNRNFAYTMSFDKDNRRVTSTFNTVDGSSATVSLNGTLFDNFGNNTVCSQQLSTSAGTLTCTVPQSYGNSTIIAELYKDGTFITQGIYSLKQNPEETFGGTRVIMALILFITLPLMALTSGAVTVFFGILGLITAAVLNLWSPGTTTGSMIGAGATILWFIIAGGVIIWRISR